MVGVGKEVIEIWAILGFKKGHWKSPQKNHVEIFGIPCGEVEGAWCYNYLCEYIEIWLISITSSPTPTIFCHIRAIQTPNHSNITKYHTTW